MMPFERLRAIARHSGDDRELVTEAAECLAEFDDDPASLVVTCRRLLHHHPACGPLWWLCARVISAADPSDAAWEAEERVRDDPTPTRLAAVLPFPHDRPVAVLGWPELTGQALVSRPDLDVLTIQGGSAASWRRRAARIDARAHAVDTAEAAALEPSHVLAEVMAAGPDRALVPEGTGDALHTVTKPTTIVWLVAGVGRVLPGRLFDVLVAQLDDPERPGHELLDLQNADRIAGPSGLDRPENLGRRADCPVAPELLRIG